MFEALTAFILITFTALIVYVIGRLFKKKPKPVDEIKLQKIHVMRLGPFSGQSNSFKGKSIIFMMLLSSLSYADVSITTLSNWYIGDLSEGSLLVSKGETSDHIFAFQLERPYCISEAPLLMLRTKTEYSDGDKIHAQIKVDKDKPKPLKLVKEYGFDDHGEYVTWWKMKEFPSLEKGSLIEINFKSVTPLKDFSIDIDGIEKVQYQAEQICQSPVPIREVRMEKI